MEPAIDPRPQVAVRNESWMLAGARCPNCEYRLPSLGPWCPLCHSDLSAHWYGPGGTVWASTVVRVPVGGYPPPRQVAYVDLDDGPRVLCQVEGDADVVSASPGARVQLTGPTPQGDPMVRVTG